jgi:hypothetical protein
METENRAAILNELQATRAKFMDALQGITEAQAKFKPAPDRWSIEECAEHVAVVEKGMLARITDESSASERSERAERQSEIRQFTLNRVSKRQAPERVVPTGRFPSLAKSLEAFSANRDVTIAFVRSCKDDLHARSIVHPTGPMTCHEGLILLANHPLRHLEQIREIQATPGYPAKGASA